MLVARDRRNRRARPRPRRAHVRPAHDLGPAGARRRVRPARRALLALPPPVVRLLRPQPDGAAHVACDDRPAVGALLPRLRPDLLRPARRHDRRRHGRAVRLQLETRARCAVDHAGHRAHRVPLQPRVASRPSRRAAELGRGRDGCGGVDHRRPRREVLRARGPARRSALRGGERPSSERRSRRIASARSTFRCSRSCRSSPRRSSCSPPDEWSISGSLSLGAFFAFNLLLAMLVMPLRMLGMWIGQAQRAIAAGERIFEILDEPEEVADRARCDSASPGPGEVVFEDVSFGYDPERPRARGRRPPSRSRAGRSR